MKSGYRLDEFPDMLPEHDGMNIIDDGGVGAKLRSSSCLSGN